LGAKLAGYDVGSAAGLYAGSQTISASMGLATDAINRLGLPPEETKKLLDGMPVAYAVTYIFGTVGSAIVIACSARRCSASISKPLQTLRGKARRQTHIGRVRHGLAPIRAARLPRCEDGKVVGKTVQEAEALLPDARVFVQRIRRGHKMIDATTDTVIQAGDVLAIAGRRDVLVNLIGAAAEEVDDRELLAVPIEGVDVYITSKDIDGKTLAQLAKSPARAASSCARSRAVRPPPIFPFCRTRLASRRYRHHRRRTQDVGGVHQMLGSPTGRPTLPMLPSSVRRSPSARCSAPSSIKIGSVPLDAIHLRRGLDRRPVLRLAALRAPDLRPDSLLDRLVHELGRPQRLHRRGRHLLRAGLRRRPAASSGSACSCGVWSSPPCR
jgi:putative transport protein